MTSWIQVGNGRPFDLTDPKPEQVSIPDIARSLSRIARYNGYTATPEIYSVAMHSVLVFRIVRNTAPNDYLAQLWALLHDAHEAYTGDITTPVQQALGPHIRSQIVMLQDTIDRAILQRLEIDVERVRPIVARADRQALATEKERWMLPSVRDWGELPPPVSDFITVNPAMRPPDVEMLWLRLFFFTWQRLHPSPEPDPVPELMGLAA